MSRKDHLGHIPGIGGSTRPASWRKSSMTAAQRDEAAKLYLDGWTARELAERYSTTVAALRQWLPRKT